MPLRPPLHSGPFVVAAFALTLTACPAKPPYVDPTGTGGGDSTGSGGQGGSGGTGATSSQGGTGGGLVLTGGGGGTPCDPQCSGDLHAVVDCNGVVVKSCPDDQGCGPNLECIPACDAAKAGKSTVGCEYYTQQSSFGCFAAFILNSWSVPVTIAADNGGASLNISEIARIPAGNGQSITYTPLPGGLLAPNEVAILFLSGSGCPGGGMPSGSFSGKPFHIVTSAPVVGYDIDPYGGGDSAVTSATLMIPTSAWDTNYIAVAPWPFGPNSQNPRLTINASEDDTKVTINPLADIAGGILSSMPVPGTLANTPATYTLQKGDSLQFEQQAELTGSAILSDKPVGVIGSSGCINIDACCCDGAHQQIPPVRALGSEYVAVRYRNRVEGKEESPPWRIVGAVDGTVLTYDPAPPAVDAPAMLNLGQVFSFRAAGPFTVKSQDNDHPFYMSGYMTGGGDFGDAGDPEFVNVIPAKQYLSAYTFFADPTYPETDLVLVRARGTDDTFKDVMLDCAGAVTGWQPVGASGAYEYTRFDLVRGNFEKQGNCDNGRRQIESEAPFGLTVWGWGTHASDPAFNSTYVSYAYPAGARVQSINNVIVLPEPR
jgi:hypothetical protein